MLVGLYNIGDSAHKVASKSSGTNKPVPLFTGEEEVQPVKKIITAMAMLAYRKILFIKKYQTPFEKIFLRKRRLCLC